MLIFVRIVSLSLSFSQYSLLICSSQGSTKVIFEDLFNGNDTFDSILDEQLTSTILFSLFTAESPAPVSASCG